MQFHLEMSRPKTLAPFQTLLVALTLSQSSPVPSAADFSLPFTLRLSSTQSLNSTITFPFLSSHTFLSTFLSTTLTPSYATYTPPSSPSRTTFLALHGAGVEASSPFCTESIPRQKGWIVGPTGGTTWGYDWHGASLGDVRGAVSGLERVRERWEEIFGRVEEVLEGEKEGREGLVLLGHSNGGQGAWYFMSRFPDEVLGGVPAAG